MKLSKAALLVFAVLTLTYAYFYQDPQANGNTRIALTMAIVKEGRLNIDYFISHGYTTGDLATYQGKYYADKAIGSSVLGAAVYYPIYRVLRHYRITLSIPQEKQLLTFLITGLPSAIAGTLMFILCEYLSKSRFRAFIVTLAIALGTMYFPFSVIFFGNQLAASFLFSAFFAIFQLKTQPDAARFRNLHTFLIGLLLGLAFLTDYTTAVVILPLAAYYFYVLRSRKLLRQAAAWVAPVLGGLIPILVLAAYNIQVYGAPFTSGYQYLYDPTFRAATAQGFMGIGLPRLDVLFYETFHPAKGIFWQSPVLLMAFVGGYFMLRQKVYRAELAVAAFAFIAYLLLNAGYFEWWGGHALSVRLVVPMLPFLCLPLVFVPRKLFPIVILLTLVSVAQMGIVAASRITIPDDAVAKIPTSGFFAYTEIYDYCLQQLAAGKFAWNIGNAIFGLKSWASLLPISLVVLGSPLLMAFFHTRINQYFKVQTKRHAS